MRVHDLSCDITRASDWLTILGHQNIPKEGLLIFCISRISKFPTSDAGQWS